MEFTNVKHLIKQVEKGNIAPVYILQGDEPYFIDEVTDYIENNVLTESEKAFNLSILYGREIDSKQVLDHARQFPMMSERRVVIIKEAQSMKDLKGLETYITQPSPQSVLVVAHKKKIDGRTKWVKEAKIADSVVYFTSNTIPDYKLSKWIFDFVRDLGYKMSPDGAELLAQYLGNDLKKITNEIDKIKLNLKDSSIDLETIRNNIGVSRDFDIYALLSALSKGDTHKVHEITDNLERNVKDQPLQRIIPGMAAYFEKALIVAQHFKKDDKSLASLIGTYPNFVGEYRNMARRLGFKGLVQSYHWIVEADGMSKGLERRRSNGILKELIGKILLVSNQTYALEEI